MNIYPQVKKKKNDVYGQYYSVLSLYSGSEVPEYIFTHMIIEYQSFAYQAQHATCTRNN
jgi:hypothetical protein